jgi:hypothetical protein
LRRRQPEPTVGIKRFFRQASQKLFKQTTAINTGFLLAPSVGAIIDVNDFTFTKKERVYLLVNEADLDGPLHQWPKIVQFTETVLADVSPTNRSLVIHMPSTHIPVNAKLLPVITVE